MQPSDLLAARTPLIRVLAGGKPIAGALAAQVVVNNHYAADRFRITLAAKADPDFPPSLWANTGAMLLEVQMGLAFSGRLAADWQSMVQGNIDSVTYDPVATTITLEGRDLIAALIEARTQETFANHTASEIATILAHRHNLTPVVTPTTTMVGQYYQLEHDRITLDGFARATSEWNLLVFLAEQEGFDVYVSGTSLYFQPPDANNEHPFVLTATPGLFGDANLISLRCERFLTLASDIEVTVKSWNTRQNRAFTETVRGGGSGGARGGIGSGSSASDGPVQRYVFVKPNLTPQQALDYAQKKLAELSQHERVITAVIPGELTLTPRNTIALSGTNTAFDQTYYVDQITRTIDMRRGFTETVRAKNTSPLSQATVPAAPLSL